MIRHCLNACIRRAVREQQEDHAEREKEKENASVSGTRRVWGNAGPCYLVGTRQAPLPLCLEEGRALIISTDCLLGMFLSSVCSFSIDTSIHYFGVSQIMFWKNCCIFFIVHCEVWVGFNSEERGKFIIGSTLSQIFFALSFSVCFNSTWG